MHSKRSRRLKKHSAYDEKSSAIDVRDEKSKDLGTTTWKNRSKIINSESEEKNVFEWESNSWKKASHSKRARRLKKCSAYNGESSTIDIRDSASEDVGITTGTNLSQIIIPANEE